MMEEFVQLLLLNVLFLTPSAFVVTYCGSRFVTIGFLPTVKVRGWQSALGASFVWSLLAPLVMIGVMALLNLLPMRIVHKIPELWFFNPLAFVLVVLIFFADVLLFGLTFALANRLFGGFSLSSAMLPVLLIFTLAKLLDLLVRVFIALPLSGVSLLADVLFIAFGYDPFDFGDFSF